VRFSPKEETLLMNGINSINWIRSKMGLSSPLISSSCNENVKDLTFNWPTSHKVVVHFDVFVHPTMMHIVFVKRNLLLIGFILARLLNWPISCKLLMVLDPTSRAILHLSMGSYYQPCTNAFAARMAKKSYFVNSISNMAC